MLRTLLFCGCLLLAPTFARSQPATPPVEAGYDIYARGFEVAELQAAFALGPTNYQMQMTYRTTGLIGALFSGHQLSTVRGSWQGDRPAPSRFFGEGFWRGEPRRTVIDYDHGHPLLREMVPANDEERDSVPPALQANTVDTLSALAMLMRHVQNTGRCEAAVTTFDGRRLAEIAAHTAGEEILPPTARSTFSGRALRCDFDGRQLGGFVRDVDQDTLRRPQHGSAWLAEIVPGAPRLPVRITFETRWFGPATMYLTKATPRSQPFPASD
jgi:hypothetical protein